MANVHFSYVFYFISVLLATITFTSVSGKEIKIGITQWGDTRSHMMFMQKDNLPEESCHESHDAVNCIGGIPQLLGYIKASELNFTNQGITNKFRFATGNLVSGENGYLSLLNWTTFGNLLKKNNTPMELYHPDFMSLGIKEFESGLIRTEEYLKAAGPEVKTIITNTNCPLGNNGFCGLISPTGNLTVEGKIIDIVGFVNPLANNLSDSEPVIFSDPATAIAQAIKTHNLKSVIAVGTGNYKMAESIIDKSDGVVKLVIYGGGTKDLTGNYPAKYKNSYIATTGSKYGTKLGSLILTVDDQTNSIVDITGTLQSLDLNVTQDIGAMNYLNGLMESAMPNAPLGTSRVDIDGASCWEEECNLGNLVTDAMVHCAYNYNKTKLLVNTTGIISVWHGGAFLNDTVKSGEVIKNIDVHKWLPYHNNANFVKMEGKTLRKLFESSATGLSENPNWGQFLQVSSGVEVIYDNKKISKILTVHTDKGIPEMRKIEDGLIYNVVIPSIIQKGKSVFSYVPAELIQLANGDKFIHLDFDDECLAKYLRAMGPVAIGFEKRISLEDESYKECSKKTGLTVFLTLFITALIIGSGYALWRFVIKPRRENGNCI